MDKVTGKNTPENRNYAPKMIFLIPSLGVGGAERVASALLPSLAREFDVKVVLLENRISFSLPQGVRILTFSRPLSGQASHIVHMPYHFLALVSLILRDRIRLVMSFMEQANILNILSSRLTGHKAIISQRIEPGCQYSEKGMLGRLILRASHLVYPLATHVIAVSARLRQVLLASYSLAPEQITFIPNPVNIESFRRQSKASLPAGFPTKFVLNVGRMRLAQKAQDSLIRAFHVLRKRQPDLVLVLVGDGEDRKRIEREIRELKLNNAVIMTGWKENVAAFMARAQAFVLASRYEGWPNALIEAMSCGCPVVATDCETGPREIIGENEYGLLVPVDNVQAMVEAVEELLLSESKREYYRQMALKRAEDFQLEVISARYCSLLRRFMD